MPGRCFLAALQLSITTGMRTPGMLPALAVVAANIFSGLGGTSPTRVRCFRLRNVTPSYEALDRLA
jgi:hypothetical protein